MSKIQRSHFLQQNANKKIDLDKAEAKINNDPAAKADLKDAGVGMNKLRRADRNHDGQLDANEAWKLADDYDHDGTRRSLISVDRVSGEQTSAGQAAGALGALLASKDLQPDKPSNDDILFVGMNEAAKDEASHLRANMSSGSIQTVFDSKEGDGQVKVDGHVYDLGKDDGVKGFVSTLGLPAAQSAKIEDVFKGAREDGWGSNVDGLDELAGITQVWAKAEKGEEIPSRMVLSGHNVGDGIWGEENGQVTWDSLKSLSKAMPEAASRVEDLHIAGCYSGGTSNMNEYKEIFPNAKTLWAYSGSAPGSWSGAMAHQKYWERATRGAGTDVQAAVDKMVNWGTRKAENISVQNVDTMGSYHGPSLSELRQNLSDGAPVFKEFFQGQRSVQDRQHGPLRGYYNQIQATLQNPDLQGAERAEVEGLRDQTIRTLFYDSHIAHKYQETYGDQLQAGYRALGMQAPDFSTLSRGDAMQAVRAYREKMAATEQPAQASQDALNLLNGLWNLDAGLIPQTWI